MALSFLYLAVRALLGALVRSRRGLDVKSLELLVLRHELERARQALARILVAESVQERGFHVVRDEGREVVECLCLSSKSRDVFDKLFLCRRSCCGRVHLS